jgi:hypothetical protein
MQEILGTRRDTTADKTVLSAPSSCAHHWLLAGLSRPRSPPLCYIWIQARSRQPEGKANVGRRAVVLLLGMNWQVCDDITAVVLVALGGKEFPIWKRTPGTLEAKYRLVTWRGLFSNCVCLARSETRTCVEGVKGGWQHSG